MDLKLLQALKQSKVDKITTYQNILDGSATEELDREIIKYGKKLKENEDIISSISDTPISDRTSSQIYDLKKATTAKIDIHYIKIPKLKEELWRIIIEEKENQIKNELKIKKLEIEIVKLDAEIAIEILKNSVGDVIPEIPEIPELPIDNTYIIDDALGISVEIDKQEVIGSIIKNMMGGSVVSWNAFIDKPGAPGISEQQELLDKQIEESVKEISNPEKGGIASIIDVFIGLLVKAIGSFAKQFFFLKDAIDKLVGLQFGPLLSKVIPGVVNVITELTTLFSNPSKFIMGQLLGPLFDINIPLPEFSINIGDFIPILPFELKIPTIDPFGFFTRDTPLNPNTDPSDISPTWQEDIMEEVIALKKEDLSIAIKERERQLEILDNQINALDKKIKKINVYTIMVRDSEIKIQKLKIKEKNCNENGCDKEYLNIICDNIIDESNFLKELKIVENIEEENLENLNIESLKIEKTQLEKERTELAKKPIIPDSEYMKKAILVAYEQDIDPEGLEIKLSKIYEIGVDINNNKNLEILQKLGYDFTNDNYIDRLVEIKNYGISLSDIKQLSFLYELGFNFNDKNHKIKIDKLRNIINIDSEHLKIFIQMGFNIHNPNIYNILKDITDMNIDILNIDLLENLKTIGFNFNNPIIIERLNKLNDYKNLSDISVYASLINRGINLNNPRFEDLFIGVIIDIDYEETTGLNIVPADAKSGEITSVALEEILIQFNQLGLNIRDINFQNKFNSLYNKLNLAVETSILIDSNDTITITKFNILQKLGFNYQIDTYNEFLNLFKSLFLNLNKYETKIITDIFISLGWHWSLDRNFTLINKFINFGFSFKIETTNTQMFTKLEKLNTFGFNFSRVDSQQIIDKLSSIDISLSNNNFSFVIGKLIAFGINLNDKDWSQKLQIFIDNSISFSDNSDWDKQMSNLMKLGISFIDDDWNKNYNKMKSMRQMGLDFTIPILNKKLSILTDLGIDFTTPEPEWKKKLNDLIQIKLINVPENIEKNKQDYLNKRNDTLNIIEKNIKKYQLLNENPALLIDNNIKQKNLEIIKALNENDNEQVCDLQDEIKSLELSKLNIITLNPNYDKEIAKYKLQKENLDNNVSELNEQLIFAELDKFEALKKSNISLQDDDIDKNINFLVENKFSFDDIDWLALLMLLGPMLPINPISLWMIKIIEFIKGIIMIPIMMLMGILEKFLKIITDVVGIPLNPLDIPPWGVSIIKSFMDLVEMIMLLPTLKGMLDFLIMSPDGLALVDIWVPGFSLFISMMFDKIEGFKKTIIINKELLKKKQQQLEDLKAQQKALMASLTSFENPLDDLNLDDLLPGSLLPETTENNLDQKIRKLNIKKLKLLDNNNQLKDTINPETMNINELNNIQLNMENNCDKINSIENAMDEMNDLSTLNSNNNDIDDLASEISNLDKSTEELEENVKNMSNICDWGKNMDTLILNILKGLIDDLKGKPNTAEEEYDTNQKEIDKLESSLDTITKKKVEIENYLNQTSKTPTQIKNNLKIKELSISLEQLEEDFCDKSLTKNELDNLLNQINDLKNNISILNKSNDKNAPDISSLATIETLISGLNIKLEQLNVSQTKLATESASFMDMLNLDLLNLDSVAKNIPGILNIICTMPKMIVNIFIGIINNVGNMSFLPKLWEFPFI